jgi:hypothetical protein
MQGYPQRSTAVHVEQLGQELAIYDWERKEVHALNATAARVWQLCDGQTSPDQMATLLAAEWGVADAAGLVALTLKRLAAAHLLTATTVLPAASRGVTRREVLKQIVRFGAAAAILPLINSIPAPVMAQAASPTPTSTATTVPTSTSTAVPTSTSTSTAVPTNTSTATASPTDTATATATATDTATATATETTTVTATPTNLPLAAP